MSEVDRILHDDSGSGIGWFFVGAAVGVTLGMLLAPKSGRDTRQYIADRAGAGREAVTGMSRDVADRGKEYYEKGRGLATEASDLFERGRRIVRGENPPPPEPTGETPA
jgi:gas vesicle protein